MVFLAEKWTFDRTGNGRIGLAGLDWSGLDSLLVSERFIATE